MLNIFKKLIKIDKGDYYHNTIMDINVRLLGKHLLNNNT